MHWTHSMSTYLAGKYKWTPSQIGNIDWASIPTKIMRIGKRIYIASYSHQWLPLNEKLHERNTISSPLFPMCDKEQDNHTHFIRCKCKCYKADQETHLRKRIKATMKKKDVDPYLQIILFIGLKASAEWSNSINVSGIPGHYMTTLACPVVKTLACMAIPLCSRTYTTLPRI